MRGRGLEVDGHPVNCCPYPCMEDEGGGGGGLWPSRSGGLQLSLLPHGRRIYICGGFSHSAYSVKCA